MLYNQRQLHLILFTVYDFQFETTQVNVAYLLNTLKNVVNNLDIWPGRFFLKALSDASKVMLSSLYQRKLKNVDEYFKLTNATCCLNLKYILKLSKHWSLESIFWRIAYVNEMS